MSITPIDPVYDDCALWPIDPACLTGEWESLDPKVQARSLALASATLRRLSGYRVTNCPITVRPCKRSCANEYGHWSGGVFVPHIDIDGRWVNNGCRCLTDCSCGALCEVPLPGPVGRLDEVNISGTDFTSQVAVQGNNLVWVGDPDACPFPSCQDLAADPGEPNTFTVTYVNGYPPDSLASYAVGVLALEYARACIGSDECQLPVGTTAVVRQGISIEIATGSFPNGMTGIREVDAWIALWRPEGSPKWAPRVWSPDRVVPRIQR